MSICLGQTGVEKWPAQGGQERWYHGINFSSFPRNFIAHGGWEVFVLVFMLLDSEDRHRVTRDHNIAP